MDGLLVCGFTREVEQTAKVIGAVLEGLWDFPSCLFGKGQVYSISDGAFRL